MAGVAFFDIDSFQLEEGVVATEYEPPAPAPDYPIEIHSLNDFDVVSSVGKRNLLNMKNRKEHTETVYISKNNEKYKENIVEFDIINHIASSGYMGLSTYGTGYRLPEDVRGSTIFIKMDEDYQGNAKINISEHSSDGSHLRQRWVSSGVTDQALTINEDSYITFIIFDKELVNLADRTTVTYENYSNQHTPAPEDITEDSNHPLINKINLLLSEPLRSVGNVKDRLFRDSDGLWKIERNLTKYSMTGNENIWSNSTEWYNGETGTARTFSPPVRPDSSFQAGVSSHMTFVNTAWWGDKPEISGFAYSGSSIYPRIANTSLGVTSSDDYNQRHSKYVNYVRQQYNNGTPITFIYKKANPIIETLDQEYQDKLNNLHSFQDSNYVYTVINDKTDIVSENLKPILHATFKGGGWYNRWKTEDELRKHQAEIDDKADNASTEESINNAIANIQVLQQELEAAATANELDDFIDRYNKDMAARNKDASQSEENLSTALSSISTIEKDLGEMSETWTFIDRFIKNTPEGIVVGNDTTGSYILIKEDRLSFYSNNQEVAFISQNLMEISRGAFVEEIQIAKYKFEESTDNHLTIRYVG